MNQTIKTPKTLYVILAAGALLGSITTASILGGYAVGKAHAQKPLARTIGTISTEKLDMLRSLDSTFAGLAEYISPAVVNIRAESTRGSDVFGNRLGRVGGEGSGVIFRPDGWILTNDHVVGGFEKVTVTLNDGREFTGTVRRSDFSDLAVVKVEAKDLPTVQFADSNKVRPGQFAIAVGSPFGLENSVTIGHVSALGRATQIGDAMSGTERLYPDLIQTDAAINMGNSGGPLLDVEGRVIGINTAIFSGTGGSVGIGFAIPSNQARLTAEALITKGKVVRGFMGVSPVNLKEYQKKELGIAAGAYIAAFSQSNEPSPARDAGLKEGDVITRIGGLEVTNQADLRNAMLRYGPGETVTVEYYRNKTRKTVSVKLVEPPKTQSTAPVRGMPRGGGEEVPAPTPDWNVPDFRDFFRGPDSTPVPGDETVPPIREGKAKLGVMVSDLDSSTRAQYKVPSDITGAVVTTIEPGSVAEKIGMKPGDVIQKIGDVEIKSAADVTKAMSSVKWGDTKQIRFGRYGSNMTMNTDRPVTFR